MGIILSSASERLEGEFEASGLELPLSGFSVMVVFNRMGEEVISCSELNCGSCIGASDLAPLFDSCK